MSSFTGDGELRGRLVNENTIRSLDGESHSVGFSVQADKIGKQVVVRTDEKGQKVLTEMICS